MSDSSCEMAWLLQQVRRPCEVHGASRCRRFGRGAPTGERVPAVDPLPGRRDRPEGRSSSDRPAPRTRPRCSRTEADVELAKSRLALARKNFARAADLLKSHAISQEESDIRESNVRQAEASVEEAQAAVDAARLDVEFTRVSAPVGGRVGRKLVTEGNLINGGVGTQGTLLTTIVSLDPIYAYFEADEGSLLKYSRLARLGSGRARATTRTPCAWRWPTRKGFRTQASWTSSTTRSTAARARSSVARCCQIPI